MIFGLLATPVRSVPVKGRRVPVRGYGIRKDGSITTIPSMPGGVIAESPSPKTLPKSKLPPPPEEPR